LVLHDHGLSAVQERELEQWLAADSRHATTHAELKHTWGLFDDVPVDRLPIPPRRGRKFPRWIPATLAMAAAMTVIFVSLERTPWSLGQTTIRSAVTPVGGFKKLNLPDGSVVQLNTASAVEVMFSEKERRVHLTRGEAHFVVAKDVQRPFIVRLGQVDIQAVGTVFNVRCRADAVEVLVTEGKVRVNDAVSGKSLLAVEPVTREVGASLSRTVKDQTSLAVEAAKVPLLGAGQRATIPILRQAVPVAKVIPVSLDEAARELAWQSRHLEFSGEPLSKVVAEFNRYNRRQLVVVDERLAAQRFGGKFPANDTESLVHLLEMNYGVVAERREHETRLRRAVDGR